MVKKQYICNVLKKSFYISYRMVVLVKVLPFFYEKFLLKSLDRISFFAIFVVDLKIIK